jgi:hypothetical protein
MAQLPMAGAGFAFSLRVSASTPASETVTEVKAIMRAAPVASRVVWSAIATAVLAASGACENSTSTTLTQPSASTSRCGVTLAAQTTALEATGGRGSITVTTNRECQWQVQSSVDWIRVESETSGQGSASIAYVVASNALVTARRGTVSVNDERLELSQAGAPCVYTLGRSRGAFRADGGTDQVSVDAQTGCAWTASSDSAWVAASGGGSGAGSVQVTVAPNQVTSRRSARVTVANRATATATDSPAHANAPDAAHAASGSADTPGLARSDATRTNPAWAHAAWTDAAGAHAAWADAAWADAAGANAAGANASSSDATGADAADSANSARDAAGHATDTAGAFVHVYRPAGLAGRELR